MADRAGSHRHSHQHWQRIRMECTDEAYYAGYGFSLKEVTWTFSLAILFLGTSAGFLGTYVENTDRAAAV